MITSLRWIAPLTVIAFSAAVLVLAQPEWLRSASASERTSVLLSGPPEEAQILQGRIAARNRVADRLLDDEMTLAEAASWFRYLNDNPRHLAAAYRSQWPGASDGEKLCRQVINWVGTRLSGTRTRSEADAIVRRLEGELVLLLTEGGGAVELPW